jgi:spore maturation protein CgeB
VTRFAFFYQSVISDWNHGNAHFLRGLMRSLQARGHAVVCYEQVDNWSLENLLRVQPNAIEAFVSQFPDLRFERYALEPNLEGWLRQRLAQTDVAVVHEWNEPRVIRMLGRLCHELGVRALFHDTHYRVVLDEDYRSTLGLEQYAAIIAYSPSVAERYRALGFERVHVLHEAADTTIYAPMRVAKNTDVVFVGNYGDGDRSNELEEYVFAPRADLPRLSYAVYGVRYPEKVLARLNNGLDIAYRGWLPNVKVPAVYSAARVCCTCRAGSTSSCCPARQRSACSRPWRAGPV